MWDTLTRYYGIDWIGGAASLASIYCLGNHSRFGFVLGIFAAILWVVVNILAVSVAGVLLNVVLLALFARGYWKWSANAPGLMG